MVEDMAVEVAVAVEVPQLLDASTVIFKQQWSLYTKLVDSNFMEHRELFAALRALLEARFPGRADLDLLDLGCGDCAHSAAAAAAAAPAVSLASFTGVDSTQVALDAARVTLRGALPALPDSAIALVQADLKEYVREAAETAPTQFHVILASFSLHHLSLEEKAAFVAAAARCLRPGGLLAVIDVFRREGEDLESYQRRYHANMVENMPAAGLTPEEIQSISDHVRGYDRPETVAGYEAFAAAAGFGSAECAFTDSKEFGRLVALQL